MSRARAAYRLTRETTGDVTSGIQEEIVGIRQAQAFNRTAANIERFRRQNRANRDANVQAVGITAAFPPAMDLLSTLATALVIGYGGYLVSAGAGTRALVASGERQLELHARGVESEISRYTYLPSLLELAIDPQVVAPERSRAHDRDAQWLKVCHYFASTGASTASRQRAYNSSRCVT